MSNTPQLPFNTHSPIDASLRTYMIICVLCGNNKTYKYITRISGVDTQAKVNIFFAWYFAFSHQWNLTLIFFHLPYPFTGSLTFFMKTRKMYLCTNLKLPQIFEEYKMSRVHLFPGWLLALNSLLSYVAESLKSKRKWGFVVTHYQPSYYVFFSC